MQQQTWIYRQTAFSTSASLPIVGLEILNSSLDHQVTINSMIKFHLKWWMNTNRFVQGMSIHSPVPKTFPYSDTSQYGRELIWNDESLLSYSLVGRPIPATYQHIGNYGPSFRTDKALKIYSPFLCHDFYREHVASYINKQGGTHSPNLCVEVWKILQWCLKHHIVVRIRHIPDKFNVLADTLSTIDK